MNRVRPPGCTWAVRRPCGAARLLNATPCALHLRWGRRRRRRRAIVLEECVQRDRQKQRAAVWLLRLLLRLPALVGGAELAHASLVAVINRREGLPESRGDLLEAESLDPTSDHNVAKMDRELAIKLIDNPAPLVGHEGLLRALG